MIATALAQGLEREYRKLLGITAASASTLCFGVLRVEIVSHWDGLRWN